MRLRSLLLTFVLPLVLAVPAAATEDRDNSAQTGWLWYYGQTAAQIDGIVAGGFRIVDIRVQTTAPTRTYTAAFVKNVGTYAKTSWHYFHVTPTYLASLLTQNQARLTALDAYDDGTGNVRFVAVMVDNAGTQSQRWWWVYNTNPATIASVASAQNVRPILLREYTLGSQTYHAAVMFDNTGVNARGWWHYYGASSAFLAQEIANTGARLYDVCSSAAAGTYCVVLVKESSAPKWWYWFGALPNELGDFLGNSGSRPLAIEPAGTRFNAIMINNSNPLSTEISALMRGKTDGSVGCWLKRAGGAVLADINGGRTFMPASMIKTLLHAHAMRQVAIGGATLATGLVVYTGGKWTCPVDNGPFTEPLETVLTKMMVDSDNYRAAAVIKQFTMGSINVTATSLGMTGTELKVRPGCCSVTPNEMTLADIGSLHEKVVEGWLGPQRNKFYDIMKHQPGEYGEGMLATVLDQEAAAVGLTAAQRSGFEAAMRVAFMAGDNGCYGLFYRAISAYVSLPFYQAGGIVDHEYVTGTFVHGATDHTKATDALDSAAVELLRDEIHAAMLTWRDHVTGYFSTFGLGCKGSNSATPAHTGFAATGEPLIGTAIQWRLASARTNVPVSLGVGASRTFWGRTPLPLDLTALGAPGCLLRASPDLQLGAYSSGDGTAAIGASIPASPALLGAHFYSQFAVVDPGANLLQVVWSNGLETLVGGQKFP